ncbi:hypothetical protein LSAT2_012841 [Lamellibrachia satsuma]|nr:hypothetical protein LSAT2_012841 [Lamellibrachia satsuma]
MISTQPGSVALASFKVTSIERVEPHFQYIHSNNFDTMGQLFTPSLVSSTSPRRSELVVVHQSAEIFPEAYEKEAPLHWTPKHAHTHARGREAGMEADMWKSLSAHNMLTEPSARAVRALLQLQQLAPTQL